MRKVEYLIHDCLSCPFHDPRDPDGELDSYCEDADTFFSSDLAVDRFPDWCPLEVVDGD